MAEKSTKPPKAPAKPRGTKAGKQVAPPEEPEQSPETILSCQPEPKVFLLTVTTFKPYNEVSAIGESNQTQRFYRTEEAAHRVAEGMILEWKAEGSAGQTENGIQALQFAGGHTACVELRNGDLVVMRVTTMRLVEPWEVL